jgi:5-methylcytosine-specific restriction protein A
MPARAADPASSLHWRQWYSLQRWRRRAKHQLQIEPLCAQCLKQGRLTSATIADHDPPHKGDWNAFRFGPLQSLCRDCHQGKWANDRHGYNAAIGDDGLPIAPRHPFNAKGKSRP